MASSLAGVGDLVKVWTKHEGKKLAIVVSQQYRTYGTEGKVKRLDADYFTFVQSCDMEMVSEG